MTHFVLLQMGGLGAPELTLILLFMLVIPVLIFLAIRQIMLWYFRINEIIQNQQQQTMLLQQQIQLLQRQNEFLNSISKVN